MSSEADSHPHFGFRHLALAVTINVFFALNMIAMKEVVDATGPFVSLSMRMGVVALICAPFLRRVPGRTRYLLLYGALNGGLFGLAQNTALGMADNISALAIAGQLSVPFSLILGVLILKEKLSRLKLVGVLLAFAGVCTIVFDPAILTEIPAVAIMTLAALFWASAALAQRKLSGISLMTIQAWNGLIGFAILTPFALTFEQGAISQLPQMSFAVFAWLAFSCLGATLFGQGMLAWMLQRFPIATIMPLMPLSTLFAVIFSSAWFGTKLTPIMVVGGLVTLAGIVLISFSATRKTALVPLE